MSNLVSKKYSSSSQGMVLSAAVVIALVAVIGMLAALVMIETPAGFGTVTAKATSTTTTTTTIIWNNGKYSAENTNASNYSLLGLDPEQIYSSTNRSIVTLQGTQLQSTVFGAQPISVLGSGFVIQYSGSNYVITNYHVAGATSNLTVTFSDGDAYAARLVGSDPYADLALVAVSAAPSSEFHPLQIAPSSTLLVGAPVVAIGNPFGLSGSMTVGIVSQLGRTIQDPTAGNFSIANVIQFSAPINPGNSGGPLIRADGSAVGITTATVGNSQGVGFAIPSDTILREIPSLVANGSYDEHSYLGIGGTDMNYQLAIVSGTNYTYGELVENVVPGSPSSAAGMHAGSRTITVAGQSYLIGGDIIVAINGTKIVNTDALGTYLDAHTKAGQTVVLGIIRSSDFMTLTVKLGVRPPIS